MTGDVASETNICAILARSAERHPERPALQDDFGLVTYAELWDRVRSASGVLAELGVSAGDSVASLSPNCHELVVLYFATAYVGAISVPLNLMLRAGEIEELAGRVGARLLLVSADSQTKAEEAAEHLVGTRLVRLEELSEGRDAAPPPDHGQPWRWIDTRAAMILFTSGSTSRPKGCVKTHANLIAAAVNHYLTWPRGVDDHELYAIPLAGIGFANHALAPMLGGASLIIEPFSAQHTLEVMERHRATTTFLPATMLDSLLRAEERSGPRDLSSLRLCQTSYAMSERLRQAIWDRFPEKVHYSYGLTEGGMSSAPSHQFLSEPDCVGRPNGFDRFAISADDGALADIGQVGEVMIAGPDVMMGFLDDDVATSQAISHGWLHTGDLGYMDADGALHFVGRAKDMIKTGGANVAAAEVEDALRTHQAVRDAAVIGVPDDHWGEVVHAYVEIEAGSSATPDELTSYLRGVLAGYKVPKALRVVEELPHNPGGKVAKGELSQMSTVQ